MDEQNMNPFGQQGTDPFSDPYAQNAQQDPNPYAQPTQGADPFTQQSQQIADPYAQGANPYGQQGVNPYAQQGTNPYAQRGANPYGQQGVNPYAQQGTNPYAQQEANPYGQQGANPYGQQGVNPYAQQPGVNPYSMNGGTPVAPKPPKKKMSGKMKALIFGGIGLVAVAIGVYFLLTRVVFPPKKALREAVDASFTMDQMVKGSPIMDELGITELSEVFNTSGGAVDLELTMKGGSSKLDGLKVDVNAAIDKSQKKMSGEASISRNGKSLSAELYGDEEQTYLMVEDLMNSYLAISNKNIISALKNSPLMSGQDLQALSMVPDISLDFFNSDKVMGLTLGDEFWDKVEVSREGKENLTIGGDTIAAQKYDVTIKKETIQEKIDELISQYADQLSDPKYSDLLSQYGMSGTNIGSMVNQYKSIIKGMITEDLVFHAYTYDDRLVSLKADGKLKLATVSVDYNITVVNYGDGDKSVHSLEASLSVMGQKIEIKGSIISKKEGSAVKTEAVLSAEAAGSDIAHMLYSQTYDTGSKAITGSGSATVSGKELFSINVSGSVTELEKGKSVTIDLSQVDLTMQGITASFSAKIGMKSLDAGVTVKEKDAGKPVVNVLTASKEEIQSAVKSGDDLSEEFKKKLQDIFGF